ncbi:MAG: hypothetical protein F4X82_03000 [Candidatus Spechtbacteria bacterium SB0662_bin_43]|uniref:Uncharacterized protein n=1 Tax=Candidatus Spechtbacteria bacterium SB0662_bin_43 TaxID=2604897 RepID=A0A845DAI2_9BACT|nr:hypothetical protein [Candidatus Spechtbacteria bacterium SB0662_bin_43]
MKFPLLPYDADSKRGKKEKKQEYRERIQNETKSNEFFQDFVQSVRSDYENMYGSLNLKSYMDNSTRYSLKDFWIDSLRAGVTMHHNVAKRNDVLKIVEGTADKSDSRQKEKMMKINRDFFENLDFQKFKKEFILKSGKRKGANVERERIMGSFPPSMCS